MRITTTVVGIQPRPEVRWPEDWPVPRVGDVVEHGATGPLYVRNVVWYPEGDHESMTPFVYLVLGPTRVDKR